MIERHTKILELLNENKKLEVSELSQLLKVSQVTIRKDLDQLEKLELVKREHGYAHLYSPDNMNSRLAYHYNQKVQIAKKAIELVEDGETIMIESGSCCAIFAYELTKNRKDITLITNSAYIANYISNQNVKIILLGGEYQNDAQVMVGPLVRKGIENFYVDKLFVGTDGFTEKSGFTGNDYLRAEAVKDMAEHADKVIIITESNKFGQKGLVSLLPLSKVYAVVSDEKISNEYEESLSNQNVKVIK